MEAEHVLALFKNREEAEAAVKALLDAGYSRDAVGVLGPGEEERHPYAKSLLGGIVGGTAVGGVVGGVLTAVAVGLIPGVGPLLAAGTLVPVFAGTATTAATGGLAGALVALAGSSDEALYYEQQVESGSWLVSVATGDRAATADLLEANGAFGLPPREAP